MKLYEMYSHKECDYFVMWAVTDRWGYRVNACGCDDYLTTYDPSDSSYAIWGDGDLQRHVKDVAWMAQTISLCAHYF